MAISNIKLHRLTQGLKAKDVAAQLNISPSYLCKIENRVLNPTQDIIVELARLYNVKPHELI